MSPEEEEAILERLLTGELSAESSEALSYLADHPGVADRWEQLRAFESGLIQIAAGDRELWTAAQSLRDAPGEEHLTAFLSDELERLYPAPGAARTTKSRLGGIAGLVATLATAAALLLIVDRGNNGPLFPHSPTGPQDPGPMLGGESDRFALTPQGAVDSFGEFRWKRAAGPGEFFRVVIYDALDPDGEPLISSPDLTEQHWFPQLPHWPRAIYWELHLYRDGNLHSILEAEAELR